MADGEKVNRLKSGVNNNLAQRLQKDLCSVRDYELRMCTEFVKSDISQMLEMFLSDKGEQLTCMDESKVFKLINIVFTILEKNRQRINVNKVLQELNVPSINIDGYKLFKETMINKLLDLKTFLKKLADMKNYKYLLESAIFYFSHDENSKEETINNWLLEDWSDSKYNDNNDIGEYSSS